MDEHSTPTAGEDNIAIALVVRRASEPIAGTITLPDEQPVDFTGWMQLTRLIARVVDSVP